MKNSIWAVAAQPDPNLSLGELESKSTQKRKHLLRKS